MPFFDPIRLGASGSADAYEIQNSLRHNSGAYLNSSFNGNIHCGNVDKKRSIRF
mgnify:CR=1 FL=1